MTKDKSFVHETKVKSNCLYVDETRNEPNFRKVLQHAVLPKLSNENFRRTLDKDDKLILIQCIDNHYLFVVCREHNRTICWKFVDLFFEEFKKEREVRKWCLSLQKDVFELKKYDQIGKLRKEIKETTYKLLEAFEDLNNVEALIQYCQEDTENIEEQAKDLKDNTDDVKDFIYLAPVIQIAEDPTKIIDYAVKITDKIIKPIVEPLVEKVTNKVSEIVQEKIVEPIKEHAKNKANELFQSFFGSLESLKSESQKSRSSKQEQIEMENEIVGGIIRK